MDRVPLLAAHPLGEHIEQIGTPDRQIGKTVALDRFGPEVEEVPGLAGLPVADLLARGRTEQLLERIENSHGVERPGAVRTELHPGADLLESRRLLVIIDRKTSLQQGECG